MRKELYLQEQLELENIEYIRIGCPYIQSANKCSICELCNKCFYYEIAEYNTSL